MPNLPYIVYGTTSPTVNKYPLVVHNTTTGEKMEKSTNTSGQYLIDLANMSGYSVGDGFTIYIRHNSYFGEVSWILSGEGGTEQNITIYGGIDISTLRTDLWDGIYRTLQTGTYAISTDNIHAAMNQIQITSEGYPQVIIYTPAIETSSDVFKKELLKKKINIMIEIYHTSAELLKVLTDQIEDKFWLCERDNIWTNFSLFNLDMPDNDYDWWTENKKKIHRSTLNANFEYVGRR